MQHTDESLQEDSNVNSDEGGLIANLQGVNLVVDISPENATSVDNRVDGHLTEVSDTEKIESSPPAHFTRKGRFWADYSDDEDNAQTVLKAELPKAQAMDRGHGAWGRGRGKANRGTGKQNPNKGR